MTFDPLDPFISLDDMVSQASAGNSGPEPAELAARAGDLSRHAQDQLVKQISLDDPEAMQCLQAKVAELRGELSGPTDPPAVRLLTERVVTDWLYCYFLDLICGRAENSSGSVSPALIRRKETAHRLYLSSLKMHGTMTKTFRQK